MQKRPGISKRTGCIALLLCSFLPAALQAAGKRINSADASFSVGATEYWSPDFTGEGPVAWLNGGADKTASVTRAVPAAAPAAMADALMRELETGRNCVSTVYEPGRPPVERGTLQVSTLTLRPEWPPAYALTGACSKGELPAVFFSDGKDSFSAHCLFSDLKACAEVAASVGPAVAKAEAACMPPVELNVSGLRLPLPTAACKVLNVFHKHVSAALIISLYLVLPIPFIVGFYVFSMLFYQSLAAGGLIAFLTGWLLAGRRKTRLLLLFFAVFSGLFFSWDSTWIPEFGMKHRLGQEYCVAVAEGWLTSALVLLAGCLGVFAARRYAARNKP